MPQDRVSLEIRTARDSEQTAEAMRQVLNSLPSSITGIAKFWKKTPIFYLELLNFNQTIHFYINVPSNFEQHVVSQVQAAYPQAQLQASAYPPPRKFAD